jgi:hypothetical protein
MDDTILNDTSHHAEPEAVDVAPTPPEQMPETAAPPGPPARPGRAIGSGDGGSWVIIGQTGDGRYALVRREDFDRPTPPRSEVLMVRDLNLVQALLRPVAVPRRSGDRRGGWARPS